jgi:membrane protein implicated in regulation of membrane protease activity
MLITAGIVLLISNLILGMATTAIVSVTALAVVLDLVWKRIRGRPQEPDELSTAPSAGG